MGTKTNDNIMKKYHGRYKVDLKPSQIYNSGPSVVKYTGYIYIKAHYILRVLCIKPKN